MADVHQPHTRSRNMAAIKGKNTKPELLIRSGLHRLGFRYSLHNRKLPGKPDLYFRKYKAVIFVHGCFWHGHDCHLFKWPKTREDFWREKISANVDRDIRNIQALEDAGLRVGIIWECALKGKTAIGLENVLRACSDWLRSDKEKLEVTGNEAGLSLRLF